MGEVICLVSMSASCQLQSPRSILKGLLARQMTSHVPDSFAEAVRMVAVC